jgi:hypothetical protein
MTNDEIVKALRENANALRRVATRRSVVATDEADVRLVATNLDAIALEFATNIKAKVETPAERWERVSKSDVPFGEEGPR